jgi:hypothetical protein
MAFIPRAEEVAAITAILNSDEHDDDKSMAKALLRQAAELIANRETWAVFPSSGVVGHGPYWSSKDAERAWSKGIGETYGSQGRLLRVRPVDPTDAERGGTCVCTHSRDIHQDKGKCAAFMVGGTGPKAKTRPNMPQCGCSGFEQRKV